MGERPYIVIAGLPGDAESLVFLERARLILGHPVVDVVMGEHLDPTTFDTAGRVQTFVIEAAKDMPPPRIMREPLRERPAHERIAAQKIKHLKPRRR